MTHGENFVPYAEGAERGLGPLQIIAEHFGVRPERIKEVHWSQDVCHLAYLVSRLSLKDPSAPDTDFTAWEFTHDV